MRYGGAPRVRTDKIVYWRFLTPLTWPRAVLPLSHPEEGTPLSDFIWTAPPKEEKNSYKGSLKVMVVSARINE